ncbi:MAG: hypothetical protein V1929_08495 [bacterium]
MTDATIIVPRFHFTEPRHNLPTLCKGRASAEDRFSVAFARAYWAQAPEIHARSPHKTLALVREIPVNGYGIADLLAVAWTRLEHEYFPSAEAFAAVARPTCRAFEMKLSNWQKALSQASRYRNFAHQAIVVLPPDVCAHAMKAIDTFKLVRVGLWSFDPETTRIRILFTPRRHRPRSLKYWFQSLEKAAKASRPILPIRETDKSRRAEH